MIGDRIKRLRSELGHTQESLAELMGVDTRQIWRYENGESIPKGDVIVKLAEHLNTSADYLLEMTDDPTPWHLSSEHLSAIERSVITAWRRGDKMKAIKAIVD